MYKELNIDDFLGQIDADKKTLCDVINLPEPFKTNIIEKLDSARTYKINSVKDRKVVFGGKAYNVKKGMHEYPLNFGLWLLNKHGEGAGKRYGKVQFEDLNCKASRARKEETISEAKEIKETK